MGKYYIEVKIQSSTHITYGDKPNKNNEIITSFMLKEGEALYQNYECNFTSQEISDSGFYEHTYIGNVNLIYPFVNQNGEQINLTKEEAIYEVYQLVNENQKSFQLKRNLLFNNCYVSFVEELSGGLQFSLINKVNNIPIPAYAVIKKTIGLNGVYRLLHPTKQTYEIQKIYDLTILKNYYDNGGVYYDNLQFVYSAQVDEHIDLNTKETIENCYNISSTGNKKEYLSKRFYNTLQEAEQIISTLGYIEEPVCLAEKSYDGLILPVNSKPFFIRQPQWFYVEYTDIVNNEFVKTTDVQFWKNEEIPELYLNKYYVSESEMYLYPGYEHVSLTLKDTCPSSEGINNKQEAWYYFVPPQIDVVNSSETFVIPVQLEYEKDLSEYFFINYEQLQMSFEISEGQLPKGFIIDENGLLHGKCSMSETGNYTFKVRATSYKCENEILFESVKVTNNQIFGIEQNKQFLFYNNHFESFDLKEGLTQSPLQQDFIFSKGENFPTNVSLTEDGILSANITSIYGFEFEGQENSGIVVDEQQSEQIITIKTTSSADYEQNIKLSYSRYFIQVVTKQYNMFVKYQEQKTLNIPIVYNIVPNLEIENSIQGVDVFVEGNYIKVVSNGANIVQQSFVIVLNKNSKTETRIVVDYECASTRIQLSVEQINVNGYWLMPIDNIDLTQLVSNDEGIPFEFSLEESSILPDGIKLRNGVISGTLRENIEQNSSVNIIVSCENAFDKKIKINFNIQEWFFEISDTTFDFWNQLNQNVVLQISNVEYNKIPEIKIIQNSKYNINYYFENKKLMCSFKISEEISFKEVIEICGKQITMNYTIGEAIQLFVEQHLNNFVYYEYPLKSGASEIVSVEYKNFKECTDYLTYVGSVQGYPWRNISIKNNKLIFKVFRSNVAYSAKMICVLNTGEKYCLNVEVNNTAPFVELKYKLDYNGGCIMPMTYTNYHYHHRCSPISSKVFGEIKYTVLSKSDEDIISAVDSQGSLTMTTMKNDRKAYIGWAVFRVYNNGGHGDYLLSCQRTGNGNPKQNIQQGF